MSLGEGHVKCHFQYMIGACYQPDFSLILTLSRLSLKLLEYLPHSLKTTPSSPILDLSASVIGEPIPHKCVCIINTHFHMYKLDLEKSEEPEMKLANIHWITKKAREFQKNI